MHGKIPKLNRDVMKLILLFVNNTDKLFKCSMRRRTQKYNKNKNTIKQDILFEIKYFFGNQSGGLFLERESIPCWIQDPGVVSRTF